MRVELPPNLMWCGVCKQMVRPIENRTLGTGCLLVVFLVCVVLVLSLAPIPALLGAALIVFLVVVLYVVFVRAAKQSQWPLKCPQCDEYKYLQEEMPKP